MRIPGQKPKVLIGAWKAYLDHTVAVELANQVRDALGNSVGLPFEVAVCPSFVSLATVETILRDSGCGVGAQDVYWKGNGAYTGRITPRMLVDVNCRYVILGHSELRADGEDDNRVNQKTLATLQEPTLRPVICVGESHQERKRGNAVERVTEQVLAALQAVQKSDVPRLLFAYEPIWAIKSEQNPDAEPATAEQIREMHRSIQKMLCRRFGEGPAATVRILYGGSVSAEATERAEHVAALAMMKEVGGFLVGSASIGAASFIAIVNTLKTALAGAPSEP